MRWAFKSVITVLDRVEGAPNAFRERPVTWEPRPITYRAALFPVSNRGLERAGLREVVATRELYAEPGIRLEAETTRVMADGELYHVRDVQEWGTDHVYALLEEV